ncbi:hypothetical protein CDL15_Pgr020301 [Punica granatum]|nr:hypothetical protein CDL15_Pgr020301 [Punica granatum]
MVSWERVICGVEGVLGKLRVLREGEREGEELWGRTKEHRRVEGARGRAGRLSRGKSVYRESGLS